MGKEMIKKALEQFFKTLTKDEFEAFMSEDVERYSPKWNPAEYAKFGADCQFDFKSIECVYDSDVTYEKEAFAIYKFVSKETNESAHVKFMGFYSSYGGFDFNVWAFVEQQPVTIMQWVIVA
jgi:hypothetical protein